jgi:hypothetical protein
MLPELLLPKRALSVQLESLAFHYNWRLAALVLSSDFLEKSMFSNKIVAMQVLGTFYLRDVLKAKSVNIIKYKKTFRID